MLGYVRPQRMRDTYDIGPDHHTKPDLTTINRHHIGTGYDRSSSVPAPPTTCQSIYDRRAGEIALVKRLQTNDKAIAHAQLCVYGKHANGSKRLLGIVMYAVRGTVWLDVNERLEIVGARNLHDVHVSQALARNISGVGNDVHVFLQSFDEVIRSYEHSMSYERRTHKAGSYGPHDRRVGEYVHWGKPLKQFR